MSYVVETRALRRVFGARGEVVALDSVDLSVRAGEVHGLRAAGLAGIPRRQTRKNPKIEVRSEDLVNRNFLRTQPHLLWLCGITEHPTREGKTISKRSSPAMSSSSTSR
jgi:hypothetical protein